jgi:hypothetical protein
MGLLTPGYFNNNYFTTNYWQDDYWTDASPVPFRGKLLTPGYWIPEYWTKAYWHDDYWTEYGTITPPVVPPVIEDELDGPAPLGGGFPQLIPKIHKRYFSHVPIKLFVDTLYKLNSTELHILTSYRYIPSPLVKKIDSLLFIDEDLWLAEK